VVDGKLKPEYSNLTHKWLFLEEPESELTFEEKDGKVYCFDPDLWARPQIVKFPHYTKSREHKQTI